MRGSALPVALVLNVLQQQPLFAQPANDEVTRVRNIAAQLREVDPNLRLATTKHLGQSGSALQMAARALSKALTDRDERVRPAAAYLWGSWVRPQLSQYRHWRQRLETTTRK